MNILEVIESCGAGVGRHVISLCCGLISEGHRVSVAYSPYRMDEAFKQFMAERQGEIRFFPLEVQREVSPVDDLKGILQLLYLIRREGPFDVIHGHSSKGGALARIAGRLSAAPVAYTPNGLILSSPEISKRQGAAYGLIELLLGRFASSMIIAVSEEEGELILRLKLAPKKRVVVIENGLQEADFSSSSEGSVPEGFDSKPLTFGSTMRFSPQKAPEHMVEAFARVAQALPQVPMRLVIAGDGELFSKVKDRVEEREWSNISLLGWRTDTQAVLRELDIFVLSSLYEGFSYTVLEAMAAGLPVVSTAVFGTRRTLARVPGNVLVPAGDVEALACGMQRMAIMTKPESLRLALGEIGKTNRSYVREHFMQDGAIHRTVELYRKLCERPSIRPFRKPP